MYFSSIYLSQAESLITDKISMVGSWGRQIKCMSHMPGVSLRVSFSGKTRTSPPSVYSQFFTHKRQDVYFLTAAACLVWLAMRSRSLRPCGVRTRPPLGSLVTSFSCSRVWSTLRATEPEPRVQWLGVEPLLRRTGRQENRVCSWYVISIKKVTLKLQSHRNSTRNVCGVKYR